MTINFVTGQEQLSKQLKNLPSPKQIKIRRKIGSRGFMHKRRVVEEGEMIECDADIAEMLIRIGKAELAA